MIRSRKDIVAGHLALVMTVTATVVGLPFGSQRATGFRLALILVAVVSFGAVLVIQVRRPFLTRRCVVAAAVATLVVAVAVPPQDSADLWSYSAYGRTVVQYHRNPYRTDPDDVGPDAVTARVAPGWRETPPVYGPGFVAVAAAGSELAGSSPLANRLFWQSVAGLAVLASMWLLIRQGCETGALAFLGLNPVIALSVVNGGHNDALVGLGVLAGALLALRRHPVAAGAVLGAVALVKIVALLALGGVAVSAWRRGERAAALRELAAGLGLLGIGYWLGGGRLVLRPVLAMTGAHSRASIWRFLGGVAPALSGPVLSGLVLMLVGGMVAFGRWRPPLPQLVGTVLVVYLVGAPYVLPWYSVWALPVLAPRWRSTVAAICAATAVGLLVSYAGAPRPQDHTLRFLVHPIYAVVMPAFFAASLVWLAATSRHSGPDQVDAPERPAHVPAPRAPVPG